MSKVTRRHDGVLQLYQALTEKRVGEHLSKEEVMELTGWGDSSLKTYVSKNKLSPFLQYNSADELFTVVEDGSNIAEEVFLSAFSQANLRVYKPSPGSELVSVLGETYILEEPIGSGAVATVWRCTSKKKPATYAAKILQPRRDILESDRLPNVIRRFQQEAKNGRHLNNSSVVNISDNGFFYKDKARPFLIMSLATESLRKRLQREQTLAFEDGISVLRSCSEGLKYLHGKACIHRDIKPENILIMPNGRYVLGDLGVVSWDDLNPAFTKAGTLTREAVQLGSLLYMAPEQQEQAKDAVPASDIYSLGVTVLEVLIGRVPPATFIGAGRYSAPSNDSSFNDFLRRMLDCDSENRPNAEEVLNFVSEYDE